MSVHENIKSLLKSIPELQRSHVFIKNSRVVENKLQILLQGGLNELQIVSDFDQTITKQRNSNGMKPFTSFTLLYHCPSVPESYKLQTAALFAKYHPYELDETLEHAEKCKLMLQWWQEKNNLLKNFRLPPDEFYETAKRFGNTLRDGAVDMLKRMNEAQVPTLIFSAGIADSIIGVLKCNDMILPNIKVISNYLNYKENDIVDGIKSPMIHTLNKNEQALHGTEYYELVRNRGNVLLMGDSIGDASMADGIPHCNAVLRIGFIYENANEILQRFSEVFDIVLIDDQTMDIPSAILNFISTNKI